MKTKTNILLLVASLFAILPMIVSCSESDDSPADEYANWQSRNETYFKDIASKAKDSIALEKAKYGEDYAEKGTWKAFLSYSLNESATSNTLTDSIFVKVVKKGDGSGCPLSTDSVRVFYTLHLIPSASYKDGYLVDHSGQSTITSKIFDRNISSPATLYVQGTVRGYATALQHMHIGDRWIIYVPYPLGYYLQTQTGVPKNSMLVFEVELLQYARAGIQLPSWR